MIVYRSDLLAVTCVPALGEVELFPQQQGVGVEQGGEIFDCAATGTHDEARVYLRTPHQDPFPVAQGDPSCFFQPPAVLEPGSTHIRWGTKGTSASM